MPKEKKNILAEVLELEKKFKLLKKENPSAAELKNMESEILKIRATPEFEKALAAEEKRMGDELKKLFQQ